MNDDSQVPNAYNYIRPDRLELASVEFVALVCACLFFLLLLRKKQASLEIAFFLALPFSDAVFRLFSVQLVEAIALLLVVTNYRKIRLNYVLMMGAVFVVFALTGYLVGESEGAYSILYSLRFILTGLMYSVFVRTPYALPDKVVRFMVIFCFTLTGLQIVLWLAGLPIAGIFFEGFPRAKGLAHEPATWSIWLLTLYPFILGRKLGTRYLFLNTCTLFMTLSMFGFVSLLTFAFINWAIHWAHRGFPIAISRRKLRILVGTVITIGMLALVKPDVFDKLDAIQSQIGKGLSYISELTSFENRDPSIGSGRSSDFSFFKDKFPQYPLFGMGSFVAGNMQIIHPLDDNNPAATNAYVILLVEMGIIGASMIFTLLLAQLRLLVGNKSARNLDFLAFNLNLLIMIAGIRCFSFHEMWYAQATTIRLKRYPEAVEIEV